MFQTSVLVATGYSFGFGRFHAYQPHLVVGQAHFEEARRSEEKDSVEDPENPLSTCRLCLLATFVVGTFVVGTVVVVAFRSDLSAEATIVTRELLQSGARAAA